MFLLRTVLNILVRNASPRGPMCFRCSELLMTSAISCPLWSSVYECQRVECAFASPVRTACGGMFVMYCMQCCMSVSAVLCLVEVYRAWFPEL